MDLKTQERLKYERMYDTGIYKEINHGLRLLHEIQTKDDIDFTGARVLDAGCGSGEMVSALFQRGAHPTGIDIAHNCLHPHLKQHLTSKGMVHLGVCLWEIPIDPLDGPWDYVLSADVLEHIPEEKVPAVLSQLYEAGEHLYLRICTAEEGMGQRTIGETLHITVKPAEWWLATAERACPTAHITLRPDLEEAGDRIVMEIKHRQGEAYPVYRIPLQDITWGMKHPSQAGKNDDVLAMLKSAAMMMAEGRAEETADWRGGKILEVFESVGRSGAIHPLIVAPEILDGQVTFPGQFYTVVGNQRLTALWGWFNLEERPAWMEEWDWKVRCRIINPGDSWGDDTPAQKLHKPLT